MTRGRRLALVFAAGVLIAVLFVGAVAVNEWLYAAGLRSP